MNNLNFNHHFKIHKRDFSQLNEESTIKPIPHVEDIDFSNTYRRPISQHLHNDKHYKKKDAELYQKQQN